jgi:hypothetical protein
VAFNFQELFMKFSSKGKEIELRGITGKPSKVISSNDMTKLLKNGHQGVIAQLCSLDVQTSKPSIPQDIQRICWRHPCFFMSTYIMDAICSMTPFPLMSWGWTPAEDKPIHVYHEKLW